MRKISFWCAVVCALFLGGARLEAARVLTWNDLVPASAPLSSPLDAISKHQRKDVEFIAWVRTMRTAGMIDENAQALEDAGTTADGLRQAGLDVEFLMRSVGELRLRRAERQKQVVWELDGQTVTIPGYAIPLELDGSQIKDFLLVPFVGACIHVPPPPPNQIVFVRSAEGFKGDGLFVSVKVTGKIAVKEDKKSLYLVDGASDISAGYAIEDATVEIAEN